MRRNRSAGRGAARLRAAAACILAAVFAVALAAPASAYALVEVEHGASLTLDCHGGGRALPGAAFRLYRVGDMSETAGFTLSGAFKDYRVSLKDLDSSGWRDAAKTLAGYAAADKREPLARGETDGQGRLDFGALATGLYLVVGSACTVGGDTYRFAPFLACLPGLQRDDTWTYDVVLNPKATPDTPSEPGGGDTPETVTVSAVKHWEDDGNEAQRPEEITVTLLEDGGVYDTVTLNEGNFWRHTWRGLSAASEWSVVERSVPDHYTVSVAGETTIFTVTNTYTAEIPDEPPPEGETPDTPDTPDPPDGEVTIPELPPPLSDLPQTGLLWWPVPVLAALGLLAFSAGWFDMFRRRGRGDA